MPPRGYRKGTSDGGTPLPRRLHTRLPEVAYKALMAEVERRRAPASRLIREIVAAHYAGRPPPSSRAPTLPAATIRELARLGNNLNQVAHHANLLRLYFVRDRATACLAEIERLLKRLSG